MNLTIETSVPVITVFLQGLLSFFSPCCRWYRFMSAIWQGARRKWTRTEMSIIQEKRFW